MMTNHVTCIPAFNDNYIWLIHNDHSAVVVDPGDPDVVQTTLSEKKLNLTGILITHHHVDHTGGLIVLQDSWRCPVYAPDDPRIPGQSTLCQESDEIRLDSLDLALNVLETPGHTLSHICYHNDDWLFCGDALFSLGCGRMFEGTPEQFTTSLNKLKQLNPNTLVYCAHEYTQNNLSFAKSLTPEDHRWQAVQNQINAKRNIDLPTIPSQLSFELDHNPFLNVDSQELQQKVASNTGLIIENDVSCFAAIRGLKDIF